jgi:type IV secretory pathway TraG/TraD family ATPase VirD4
LSHAGEIGEEALKTIRDIVLQHGGKAAQIASGFLKPKTDDELITLLNEMENKNPKAHKSLLSDEPHGVFFGKQYGKYIIKPEETDGHVLVVGIPATGKSTCIAIPTLRHWRGSVFAIDIKGELHQNTHKYRKDIKVFAPHDKQACGYDPYFALKHSSNPAQEARAIAQAIIPLPSNIKDTFWIDSAQTILTGAILHYHECGCTFIETLKEILDQKARDLLNLIAEESPSDKARRCVKNYVGMDDKTLMSIFPHISNAVEAIVNNDTLDAALSKEDVVTPEDLENGQDVYIQIPEYLLEQWKTLVILMINQFSTFFEKRKEEDKTNPQNGKNRPILMLLDEFPRIGKIPKIIDGLATLRSKKITVCIIAQSLTQLEYIYGRTHEKS